MRAILRRELVVMGAQPGITAAIALHVGATLAFLLAWNQGVPLLPGTNVYEQLQVIEPWLLVVLLSWTAARCLAPERGDRMVLLSVLAAVPPSRIILARTIAVVVVLALVVAAAFPVVVIAQQMSAVPIRTAVTSLVPLLGLVVLIAAIATAWTVAAAERLAAWIGSALTSGLLLVILPHAFLPHLVDGIVWALTGVSITFVLAAWSDGALRYCHE